MKYIITGANGFIGSNIFKYLNDEKNEFILIDESFSESKEEKNVKYIKANLIEDQSVISKNLQNTDVFIHCAAICGVPNFTNTYVSGLNNNMLDMYVFGALSFFRPEKQMKVVYFSSSEVYGENSNCKTTDALKISPSKRGQYASSKLTGEFMFLSLPEVDKNYHIKIIRPFNLIGEDQSHKHGHVIPTFINRLQNDLDLEVFNCGNEYRMYCPIEDALKQIDFIIHNGTETIYNVGSNLKDNYISVDELCDLVIKIYNSIKNSRSKKTIVDTNREKILKRKPNISSLYPKSVMPTITISEEIEKICKSLLNI